MFTISFISINFFDLYFNLQSEIIIAESSQQNSYITHEQAQANQEIAKLVDVGMI